MLFKNLSWQEKVGFQSKDIRMSIRLPMEITVMVKVKYNMNLIKIQNYKTLLALSMLVTTPISALFKETKIKNETKI